MANFPIFLDLDGVPPLVVGTTSLALTKVRLLLKRARRVAVVANEISAVLQTLIDTGRIVRVEHANGVSIKGRPLVISATQNDLEDARISTIARSLGVPVNVPDRPSLCTFALAAIVDRGTVTIAIGTEGAAPVLATKLRGELEQQLHPKLGRLADLAREHRPAVAAALPPGKARRAHWEAVFAGPIADTILAGDEKAGRAGMTDLLAGTPPHHPGRVILVGAGPGDPDLLTVKAVRALKSADVIVHDGLMGEDVLDLARREAELIAVGKAKGQHSRSQAEINTLLVTLARAGKTVVRLKTGDPSIFGRGGEEIDILRASGVSVEVVPGITAATAAAASLQIPLTHRDLSRSVTFLSGHSAEGVADFDQLDFAALANGRTTLAVYMALSTARALAQTLLAAGWSPATPVVAVSKASQPGERRITTSLDALAAHPIGLGLSGPALLIVGEVASLGMAGEIERLDHTVSRPPLPRNLEEHISA